MFDSCLKKQSEIKSLFSDCQSEEAKYTKIIELGRSLPLFKPEYKTEANRVQGCQSNMFLRTFQEGNEVYFEAESDALISAGLAALLLDIRAHAPPAMEPCIRAPPIRRLPMRGGHPHSPLLGIQASPPRGVRLVGSLNHKISKPDEHLG